jgi:hypothetical protein
VRKAATWFHLAACLPGCICDGDEARGGRGRRAAPEQLLVSVVVIQLAIGSVGVTGDGELHLLQLDAVVARDTAGSPDLGSSSSWCCCCACVRKT